MRYIVVFFLLLVSMVFAYFDKDEYYDYSEFSWDDYEEYHLVSSHRLTLLYNCAGFLIYSQIGIP